MKVEGWATGVAAVNRSIDLQIVCVWASAAQLATICGNDAGCSCAAKSERVAERDDPVTAADINICLELDEAVFARLSNTQNSKVCSRVSANEFSFKFTAIFKHDLNLSRVFDNVVVCDDQAISGNEETGAERAALTGFRLAIAWLVEELFKTRTVTEEFEHLFVVLREIDFLLGNYVHADNSRANLLNELCERNWSAKRLLNNNWLCAVGLRKRRTNHGRAHCCASE